MQILSIHICISKDSAGFTGVSQIPLAQRRKEVLSLFFCGFTSLEMFYRLSNFIICLKIKDENAMFEKFQVIWD